MLKVMKFGGSSLADVKKLTRAAKTVLAAREKGHDTAVVVSAMGEETDALLAMAHELMPNPPSRELDALLSTGEARSAALFALALESMGERAMSFAGWQGGMYTDSAHGNARLEFTYPGRIAAALHGGVIPVLTGFQGVDIRGDVTTLGRGGSDTSAVALASALGADSCEIYTDVAGIYTADPRLVPSARKLDKIDTRDMLRLAQSGSQVLHAPSVELCLEKTVPLVVLPTSGEGEGTAVLPLDAAARPAFAGVTRDESASLVTLAGRDCRSNTLPELASVLTEAGVHVRGGRMGEGYASVRVDAEQIIFALRVLHEYVFE